MFNFQLCHAASCERRQDSVDFQTSFNIQSFNCRMFYFLFIGGRVGRCSLKQPNKCRWYFSTWKLISREQGQLLLKLNQQLGWNWSFPVCMKCSQQMKVAISGTTSGVLLMVCQPWHKLCLLPIRLACHPQYSCPLQYSCQYEYSCPPPVFLQISVLRGTSFLGHSAPKQGFLSVSAFKWLSLQEMCVCVCQWHTVSNTKNSSIVPA